MSKYTQIEDLIIPAIDAFGCHLYGLEVLRNRDQSTVRIFLERAEGTITIDDISKVSRQISMVLEVAGVMSSGYVLEVSSPGLDRPLLKREHYLLAIGNKVTVSMTAPIVNRKNFQGVLSSVSEDTLILREGEIEHVLSLSEVHKARVVPEIMMGRGQKK